MKQVVVSMLLLFLPMMAGAAEFEIGGIYYTIGFGKYAIVTKTPEKYGYKGEIVIPEMIEYEGVNYEVKEIGDGAFFGCTNLISVVIPNTVNVIRKNAFARCTGLTIIDLPKSIKSIPHGAFDYCSKLKNVVIPNCVTSISDFAFANCDSLRSITLPDSLVSIGYVAFQYSI